MGATIKDVARETNLAISTISKYMNGGKVKKKNRELIEAAVKKLNYSPNSSARGLRTSKTYRVGLMLGTASSPHTPTILSAIENKMRALGYSLMYVNGDASKEQTEEYLDYLIQNGVDGMIVTAVGIDLNNLQNAEETQLPVIAMEECDDLGKSDCVCVDCVAGTYEIVEHLVESGHKRIAIINGTKDRLTAKERKRGYLRVLEDYGIEVNPDYQIQGGYDFRSGYDAICKLWELTERPSAVFVAGYDICIGVMEAVNDLGIKVPEELSIVSFDDFELSVMVHPQLTTVRQPLKELAEAACNLLVRRMNGDYSDYPRLIRLKPKCIYRNSVAQIQVSMKQEAVHNQLNDSLSLPICETKAT